MEPLMIWCSPRRLHRVTTAAILHGVLGVLAEAVLAVLDAAVELADHLGAGPQEVEAVGVVVDVDLVLEVGAGQGGGIPSCVVFLLSVILDL